jgi:hypothetical protein
MLARLWNNILPDFVNSILVFTYKYRKFVSGFFYKHCIHFKREKSYQNIIFISFLTAQLNKRGKNWFTIKKNPSPSGLRPQQILSNDDFQNRQ